ncbi:MAG: hypothetical protein WC234_01770 [Endomicrobiaceae bacterium]
MKKAAAVLCMFIAAGITASAFAADEVPAGSLSVQTVEATVSVQPQVAQQTSILEQQQTSQPAEQYVETETSQAQPNQQPDENLQPNQSATEEAAAAAENKEKTKKDERIHPYIRADAGLTYTAFDVKYQDVTKELTGLQAMYNFGAGIKYKKGRFELAYHKRATMSDFLFFLINTNAWVENNAVMANVFYDYVSLKYFALYIGGGAGVNMWNSEFKTLGTKYTDNGTSFIGGIYLGASINTPIGFSIDFGVDYFYVNEPLMNSFVPKIGARLTF